MTWWRHQMETFSALLDFCAGNSPVTGLKTTTTTTTTTKKKKLSKQSRHRWFETPLGSLWRHWNGWTAFDCTKASSVRVFPYVSTNLYSLCNWKVRIDLCNPLVANRHVCVKNTKKTGHYQTVAVAYSAPSHYLNQRILIGPFKINFNEIRIKYKMFMQ